MIEDAFKSMFTFVRISDALFIFLSYTRHYMSNICIHRKYSASSKNANYACYETKFKLALNRHKNYRKEKSSSVSNI